MRRDRRSGSQDSMYRPRSGSSISSLRTGRPSGGVRARTRSAAVRSVIGRAPGLPLVRVEHEAGEGLGVEVGRLLGHHVALGGDGEDRGDGRRLEEEGGIRAIGAVLDQRARLRRGLGVADPLACGDRGGVDPGEPLERGPEQRDVQRADRAAAGRRQRANAPRLGLQQPRARAREEAEPALAAGQLARRLEPRDEVVAASTRSPSNSSGSRPDERRDAVVAEPAEDPVGREHGERRVGGSRNSISRKSNAGSVSPERASGARRGSGPRSRSGGGRRR